MTTNGVQFKKATKKSAKLRLALCGPAGSGKTKSGLRVAKGYGGRVAVIDTERCSASLYADDFDFDVLEIEPPYLPSKYVAAIRAAADYDILIIDSLSHAWAGEGGILESVDQAQAKSNANKFTVWAPATKAQNELVNTILGCPQFVIATLRSKQEYALQTDSRGKQVPVKLGMAPIQRDGVEYEFGVVLDIGMDHTAGVGMAGKDRTGLFSEQAAHVLTEEDGRRIAAWIGNRPPAESAQKDDRRPPPPPPPQQQPPSEQRAIAESAQIRARFEHTLDTCKFHTKAAFDAFLADVEKVKDKLTKPDRNALFNRCKPILDRLRGEGGTEKSAPAPETAPLDLVSELHQLIRSKSRHKTWRAVLANHGIDLPANFEEPERDGDLDEICDWLAKADALRVRDGFRQAAANVRQHNGRGPEDDPPDPEPSDAELAALDAATAR